MKRLILITILFLLLYPKTIFADSGQDQLSLSISPPLLEIKAEPGADITAPLQIQNKSNDKIMLDILFRPFKMSSSGTGQIEYLPQNTFQGNDPSFFQKVKIYDGESMIQNLTLQPLESKDLTLSIKLDKDEPVSDYYFSILFVSKNIKGIGSSSFSSGAIGTNVIFSITGDEKISGSIKEFNSPFMITGSKVPFTVLLENNSKRFIQPQGKIIIYDMFGRIAGQTSILGQHILANSQRYLNDNLNSSVNGEKPAIIWKGAFLFGVYNAKIVLLLTDNGPSIQKSLTFFAIPIYILLGLSTLAFIAIGIYIKVKRNLKSKDN